MWNTLSRESQNFRTSFHVCKHGPRHSKDQTRKSLDLEIQMFQKSDLLGEWML